MGGCEKGYAKKSISEKSRKGANDKGESKREISTARFNAISNASVIPSQSCLAAQLILRVLENPKNSPSKCSGLAALICLSQFLAMQQVILNFMSLPCGSPVCPERKRPCFMLSVRHDKKCKWRKKLFVDPNICSECFEEDAPRNANQSRYAMLVEYSKQD